MVAELQKSLLEAQNEQVENTTLLPQGPEPKDHMLFGPQIEE